MEEILPGRPGACSKVQVIQQGHKRKEKSTIFGTDGQIKGDKAISGSKHSNLVSESMM